MPTLAFFYTAEARGITSVVGRLYNETTIVSIKKIKPCVQKKPEEKKIGRRKTKINR